MLISVVVPAFNEAGNLPITMAKIDAAFVGNQRTGLHWEFIVCDNNSTDDTSKVAAGLGARVVHEPVNQIARARNTGAAVAAGQWFLFVDADSYPTADFIALMLDHMESGTCVGCGATVRVEGGSTLNRLRLERLNPFFRFFGVAGGAVLLCERDAFASLGGFNPDLFAYEDLEFVLRLKTYARRNGKRFHLLAGHPVVTSGRKGEISTRGITAVVVSNFFAVAAFLLVFVLPRGWLGRLGPKPFGYWYSSGR